MTELLLPLHPKLVHFPIALIVSALMLEAISLMIRKDVLHKAALTCYVMAALFSIPTVLAGRWEEERLHLHHPLLDTHEHYAMVFMFNALGGLLLLGLLKRFFPRFYRPAFMILVLCLSAVITLAAFYGGEMVYSYGVGVKL